MMENNIKYIYYITELICDTPETNKILYIQYTSNSLK